MKLDVRGRIRNITLPASKPLLPLFEALVNSIQAIEDSGKPSGAINIAVLRDSRNLLHDQDRSFGEVIGFEVSDNGIGFTDENFASFETSDTTYKADRGGKGVGRFMWLVAFTKVEIESHFQANGQMRVRRFAFVPEGDGVQNHSCENSDHTDPSTTVRLIGFRAKYQEACPKKTETIVAHIIEHCLEFFIRRNCPRIRLTDRQTGDDYDLNHRFEAEMVTKSKADDFVVKDQKFFVVHVRLYSSHAKEHLVHYCAHDRVVRTEKLRGRIPDLGRSLEDDQQHPFLYAAYVQSEFLDGLVNPARTNFDIATESADLLGNEVTWKDINTAVEQQCRAFIAPYTKPVAEKKQDRINRFVATEAPMYRPIMKYIGEKIDKIDPEINDDELDVRLYEAYHSLQVELHSEGQTLLRTESTVATDIDDYTCRLQAYVNKVTDINAADLARYVCHRKAILDFLKKQLEVQDDGKYRREERIHNIIFPMGTMSDDVPFDGHNLWLIDEKLAYHAFLASDKPFRSIPHLNCSSGKEPDIIVFDTACAFVPAPDNDYPAVVIVEFKRPMRNDYKADENPFAQVLGYINELRTKKAKTPTGRLITIDERTPFYCYIVCDTCATLENQARIANLYQTPDREGFFGFNPNYNAYIEVISYDKMVSAQRYVWTSWAEATARRPAKSKETA
jgi:hypothetical protein